MYGICQSPLNFYRHLCQGLESRNFVKVDYVDCLFMDGNVIVLFWVDDCIFYSKNKRPIDALILDLKDIFLLEKESVMDGFLGLKIDISMEGKVVLSQTGLIERTLSIMNMIDFNLKYTPADKIQ